MYGIGGNYDYAVVSSLPEGWMKTDSKLYGNPLHLTITASPDAPEGTYYANISVVDENNDEKLGNITFTTKITITWNIMDASVQPAVRKVGPGQPARYTVNIINKGTASDVFEVYLEGSKRWKV